MKIQLLHSFEEIISVENLLLAWKEFIKGKRGKDDVQEFGLSLIDNILELHDELKNLTYRHGAYKAFSITDPKPRRIHKARVRDRLLHHAIYRVLYPFFNNAFIADSYSCRDEKGTHAAMERFAAFGYQESRNGTRTCWVLNCDIRKFFASVDQRILIEILRQSIPDARTIWLLERVINSFDSGSPRTGLPLGNLTSQLLVNIYMNEFDQFVKHRLKARHYIRYADDFVFLSPSRAWLEIVLAQSDQFLTDRLHLQLHPGKVFIATLASGIDFLGWVHFPRHCVLRTVTKRRMFRRLEQHSTAETLNSYLGLLKHGNSSKLKMLLLENAVKAEIFNTMN